eukprot:scaffold30301_cov107-Isochrysis_galbana.AAC.1
MRERGYISVFIRYLYAPKGLSHPHPRASPKASPRRAGGTSSAIRAKVRGSVADNAPESPIATRNRSSECVRASTTAGEAVPSTQARKSQRRPCRSESEPRTGADTKASTPRTASAAPSRVYAPAPYCASSMRGVTERGSATTRKSRNSIGSTTSQSAECSPPPQSRRLARPAKPDSPWRGVMPAVGRGGRIWTAADEKIHDGARWPVPVTVGASPTRGRR